MIRVVANPIGTGAPFIISDGTGLRGPGTRCLCDSDALLSGTFDCAVQRVQPIRAPAQNRYDRRNESGTMPVRAQYEHPTVAQALQFIRDLQKSVPRLANVEVAGAQGGGFIIPRVLLRPLSWRLIGVVTVEVDFPIEFGLLTP